MRGAIVIYPRDRGQEAGCCVQLVTKPLTPIELQLAREANCPTLWRVTVWFGGNVLFGSFALPDQPSLTDVLHAAADSPELFVEVVPREAAAS